jgi:membrane-associated phospholipid phosphatase
MIDPIVPAHSRTIAWITILIILFACALPLDIPVSRWAHDSGLAGWLKNSQIVTHILRFPGGFWFTLVICAAMLAAAQAAGKGRPADFWKRPAIVLLAGIFSGINALLKWSIGRIRPYHGVPAFELHPFHAGSGGIEASYSFPSGDCSLAFAMSASLSMVIPRLWPLWWALALIVAMERIAENAHYPSDTVGGAALGIGVAFLAKKIVMAIGKRKVEPSEFHSTIPS